MTDDQKKKLEQKLWDIANTLRGKMNADEFRDYILGFIFYKYLSERLHIYANSILTEDGIDFADINENTDEGRAYLQAVSDAAVDQLGYFLKPSELFRSVAKRGSKPGQFILEDLARILNNVERSTMGTESEDDFDDLFSDMDLTSSKLGRTEEAKNTLIAKVLTHLDEIDFELEKADSDVLGDAYEYLIGQFASGAGKKAGEFYTPQEVSTILARIVTTGKTRIRNVYDPTCGSGSLLLRVAKEVQVAEFFGQEMNRTTYNLARMNMILHGIHYRNFDLKQEDTLEHPQHVDKRFEAVVANPPFSAQWSANPLLQNDDRYAQYGRLAPASKADFAFVQHMLHQLDDNGTMAVILPHGVLFRGAAEGHIREYIIKERNWLDAVIGLPTDIFYGTAIPTCILVFKKCREHPEDILFIDASSGFEKTKNQNFLRVEDIDKIVTTYRKRSVESRYSVRASLSEVAENNYILNIPRYVDTFEEEEQIVLNAVAGNLVSAQEAFDLADKLIAEVCDDLGVVRPIGTNLPSLEAYKRGLMQALFSQRLRFLKLDGSPFPDWEEKKASDLFRSSSNKNHFGDLPILAVTQDQGAVLRENIDIDIKSSENSILSYKIVEIGDFIISLRSFQGGIEYSNVMGICSPAYTILKPNLEICDGFYKQYFKKEDFISRLSATVVGIREGKQISYSAFSSMFLPYPHPDEQQKIAHALWAIDAKIQAVSGKLERIVSLKNDLLQQIGMI